MQEIKKIVVPVDLSRHTDKLVDYACYFAKHLGAEISFVHVAQTYDSHDVMVGMPSLAQVEKEQKEKAEQMMKNLVTDLDGKCQCTGTVVSGSIVDEIVNFGEKEKADLIIIGTHGTKGLEKILLGSVAERVLKRAPCPTLMYNPYK